MALYQDFHDDMLSEQRVGTDYMDDDDHNRNDKSKELPPLFLKYFRPGMHMYIQVCSSWYPACSSNDRSTTIQLYDKCTWLQ